MKRGEKTVEAQLHQLAQEGGEESGGIAEFAHQGRVHVVKTFLMLPPPLPIPPPRVKNGPGHICPGLSERRPLIFHVQ